MQAQLVGVHRPRLCIKGNQCSKKSSFFSFLSEWLCEFTFHQCKCISLFCSEANWYHVLPLSCYCVTSRLILAPKKGASELTLLREVLLQAGRAWARRHKRGQGRPPVLTLICIPGPAEDNTDLLHQLPLLPQQRKGRKNQCRWGAQTEDFKEEAIHPGPSFCISPPRFQITPSNSIYSETAEFWKWWKGLCGSNYETEIGPSVTNIIFFFSFSENASLISFVSSLKAQPYYSSSYQTALGGVSFLSVITSVQTSGSSPSTSAFQMKFPDSVLLLRT